MTSLYKLPDMPIKINFDPEDVPEIRDIWNCDMARMLWLLWKAGHITNQYFNYETLAIGTKIEELRPRTNAGLQNCFGFSASNYSAGDVFDFCNLALPYFTGEKNVDFEIEKGEL